MFLQLYFVSAVIYATDSAARTAGKGLAKTFDKSISAKTKAPIFHANVGADMSGTSVNMDDCNNTINHLPTLKRDFPLKRATLVQNLPIQMLTCSIWILIRCQF